MGQENKKILIIEDEKDMANMLRLEFEHEGYNVICAHDGHEGHQKYLDEKPDLIVLDLRLPKLQGGALCRQIRKDHDDNKTLIVMLTAQGEDADRIVGKVQGANEYITKPFDRKHLVSVANKLLAKKTSQ